MNESLFGWGATARLGRVERQLAVLINIGIRILREMSVLDDEIAQLQQDVTEDTNAVNAAVTLINGIGDQIKAAVDAALAQGATPAQLQALTDLHTSLSAETQSLAAAVAAGTPAAPAP